MMQPSLRELNRATLIALGTAASLVTVAVLPAEYGVDPTGVGGLLGLTPMGERRMAQSVTAAPAGPVAGDAIEDLPGGGRQVRIVLAPYRGREAKVAMTAGAAMTYRWTTDGDPVEFEFHGEPDGPASPGDYTSYAKGRTAQATGRFTAGFTGRHGWYWKNPTARAVVVTATVTGSVGRFVPIYAAGESAATASRQAATTADTTRYFVDLPLATLMRDVFARSAQQIWERQGYVSDADGVRSLFPKTDGEWQAARADAVRLAELSNLLLLPGRRVEDRVWIDSVAQVRAASLRLAAIAGRKDADAYLEAGVGLNDACAACHKRYAPAVE